MIGTRARLGLVAVAGLWLGGPVGAELVLAVRPDRASIGVADQRITFDLDPGRPLAPSSTVRAGDRWLPWFDGSRPLVGGSLFDLIPAGAQVVEDGARRKVLRLHGRSRQGYDWDCRVEAGTAGPLLRFVLTAHLPAALTLPEPQPTVALWRANAGEALTLGQGPESIYGPRAPILGFPAAYVWRDGLEAAIFFDLTPSTWMARDGLARFLDCRVEGRVQDGALGLGLHTRKLTGRTVRPGDLVLEFYLHQASRPARPTRLEALDSLVLTFARLHPAAPPAVPWPGGAPPRWADLATGALSDLLIPGVTYDELPVGWRDAPLPLAPPVDRMVIHPDRPRAADAQGPMGWDFSTVNNHLSAWLLHNRLTTGAPIGVEAARRKANALPLFYDPRTRLIRWGTRTPAHLAGPDMAWQCLFFHHETLRVFDALPAEDFNPAIAGRFLQAAAGLRELAQRTDYVLPQWFDPVTKEPAIQQDVPELGAVREPWQLGTYAHLMVRAHEISGDPAWQAEAERALTRLFETLRYTVANARYTRTYADPAEFPITEIYGHAYGILAARRLFERTGRPEFRRYARAFLNGLLRMTFWYDDQTDAVSRDLSNLGLFLPYGGAVSATPWETCEAQLALAWLLKHDGELPAELRELLLKLANCHRTSALLFYSPTWSDTVRAVDPALATGPVHLPVEPFYSLEGGGHRGGRAAYMGGVAIWNWWLYEALAQADDPAILALNLDVHDGYDEALAGLERNLLVYNPTDAPRDFRLRLPALPAGSYRLERAGRPEAVEQAPAALAAGVALRLEAGGALRLVIRRIGADAELAALAAARRARRALSRAYQVAQDAGAGAERFALAMAAYRRGDFSSAASLADAITKRGQQPF